MWRMDDCFWGGVLKRASATAHVVAEKYVVVTGVMRVSGDAREV
jgi:hypothetical protein